MRKQRPIFTVSTHPLVAISYAFVLDMESVFLNSFTVIHLFSNFGAPMP
jgi:hypothetical protein